MDVLQPSLQAVLATTPARWLALTTEAPDDFLRRAPSLGEWSAVDCLRHLRDAERDVFQIRLRAFLAGQDQVQFDPERDGRPPLGGPAPVLAKEFARLRAVSLELLSDVNPENLSITVTHGEYGPVRLSEMLHYWAAHDLMHTIQAERALMQPFITRSGPWRPMCADYDVDGTT